MAAREWVLKIVGDTSGAQKALGGLGDDAEKTGKRTSDAFKVIAGAVSIAAVTQFGKAIVSSASDQEQAIGALNSVFKDYSDEMNSFGQTTAENLGISRAEFSQLASVTGSMLKNAGVPMDQVASSTKDLTARAADMAAMFGGTVPEAMEAINSALKGERDPIEKYGISLKQTAVDAKAVEMGLVDAEGKVTDYGRAMATQALIMEQSADAAGTFARESDTVAGQTAIMSAQFKDLQADLGKKLLPVMVKVTKILTELISFVTKNQDWLIPLTAGIAGIVLGMKAWTLAQTAWQVATKIGTGIQLAFNAVMMANPIVLVIAAVAALVAGFVLLYQKVDWFRAFVDTAVDGIVAAFQWLWDTIMSVYNWVSDNWPLLLAIITGPFGIAVKLIVDNWETIKGAVSDALDFVKNLVSTVAEWLSRPFIKAYELAKAAWDKVTSFFNSVVTNVKNAIVNVANDVSKPFRDAWDKAKDAWDGAKGVFQRIIDGVKDVFRGLAETLSAPFREAFRAIKSLWNSTIGGFGFSVPSWVPKIGGKRWEIPRMAKGGIVTGPTIALIGEAGPEAVVPLSGPNAQGFGVTINVYALTANAEVGRKVWEALEEYERVSGRRIA